MLAPLARLVTLAAVFIASIAVAVAAPTSSDRVVEFCKKKKGEQVGGGECAHLASEALKAAGAKTRGGPDSPHDGDYVWGTQVYLVEAGSRGLKATGKLTDVKPGDIVQYRDTKWVTRQGRTTHTATAAHHTSVVGGVDKANAVLGIYEQNTNGKRYVIEGALRLNDLKEGWVRVYRPIPADDE